MNQNEFLLQMFNAATAAKHPWPAYAACEVANDSNFDQSGLIASSNNVFAVRTPAKGNTKASILTSVDKTWNGKTMNITASYIKYISLEDAFADRAATLKKYRSIYYGAINADSGEEFVMQVSARWIEQDNISSFIANGIQQVYEFMGKNYRWNGGRWSPNPARATNVIALYEANKAVFA